MKYRSPLGGPGILFHLVRRNRTDIEWREVFRMAGRLGFQLPRQGGSAQVGCENSIVVSGDKA